MANLTMLPEELRELQADVADIKLRDFHLGRVLEKFVTHLAHAHGLDPNESNEEQPAEESEPEEEEQPITPPPLTEGKEK